METALFIGFIITCVIGVPLHYLHDKVKKGPFVHWVGPVNESTWEHLKLVFFPMLLGYLVARLIYPLLAYHLFDAFVAIVVSMIMIPLLYYPIRLVLKREITWISIAIYFVAIILGFTLLYVTSSRDLLMIPNWIGLLGITFIAILLFIFTYKPPHIFLFRDPITGKFGDQC
jgi:hypothetical protein